MNMYTTHRHQLGGGAENSYATAPHGRGGGGGGDKGRVPPVAVASVSRDSRCGGWGVLREIGGRGGLGGWVVD
jgi:hypothetical protein